MTAIEEFEEKEKELISAISRWKNLINEYQNGGAQYKASSVDSQSFVVDEEVVATTQNLNAINSEYQGSGKSHLIGLINTMGQIDITNV